MEQFKCISCNFYPLVFEGKNEYDPHHDTGDKYCFSCAMREFSDHIMEDN